MNQVFTETGVYSNMLWVYSRESFYRSVFPLCIYTISLSLQGTLWKVKLLITLYVLDQLLSSLTMFRYDCICVAM